MTKREFEILRAARHMATDDEISRIFGMDDAELARWRGRIDAARTEAMVDLRYARAQATARRGPGKAGERART